jgi:hypothetical protein
MGMSASKLPVGRNQNQSKPQIFLSIFRKE